ncbi:hypothetical protein [Micromonospora sp. NPDC005806]|uniref:hypothetical protein n=1 Tax=Micromonospora sp. NPDC005806 TaxID=3364234 RepID=UPI003686E660
MLGTPVRAAPPRVDDGWAPSRPGDRRFGLSTATALVVGSVIGTGVFALPSALAGFGPISLVITLAGSELAAAAVAPAA